MLLTSDWRDVFPKLDLHEHFIGDRYPLCVDQPTRTFLRKGATWRYLGQSALPDLMDDPSSFAYDSTVRLSLNPTKSWLYAALCNITTNGTCNFLSEITLESTLDCYGTECDVDTARVVQLPPLNNPPNNTNSSYYYEYVPAPCVRYAFPDDAMVVATRKRTTQVCADPLEFAALATCCTSTSTSGLKSAESVCEYFGERVSYTTAESRCTALGQDTCPYTTVSTWENCMNSQTEVKAGYFWTDEPCGVQVQIDSDGVVNIVHAVGNSLASFTADSGDTFQVNWDSDAFPTAASGCAPGCVTTDETCLCNVTIDTSAVFTDSASVPTSDSVLGSLRVGAFAPSLFDKGTYARCVTAACNASAPDVVVWLKSTAEATDDDSATSVTNATSVGPCYLASLATSCDDTCEGLGGTCSSTTLETLNYQFRLATIEDSFTALGVTCDSIEAESTSNAAPYYNSNNGDCYPSASSDDGKKFKCQTTGSSNQQRICCCDQTPSATPTSAPTPSPSPAPTTGAAAAFDTDTIFEITVTNDNIFSPFIARVGASAYFANVASSVFVGNSSYSFRNPPTFMSFTEATARDAAWETESVLDHYVTHPNVPPFVAKSLIQRFTTSNPSPRYVETVANAFRNGSYVDGASGETFGTGEYGDLAATVAAILLDREARFATLDADTTHGGNREPLLGLIHFLRAMEYKSRDGREIELDALHNSIGMAVFYSPTVFNFYLPEYQPAGVISDAGLFAPEAQLLTGPNLIGYINGLHSLINYGLTDCGDGFGTGYYAPDVSCSSITSDEAVAAASCDGNLTYVPTADTSNASAVVDELDVLLTAGRLNTLGKSTIKVRLFTRITVCRCLPKAHAPTPCPEACVRERAT